MLTKLDPSSEAFVNAMDQISRRLDKAQRQISTGFRVNTVSDEPDSVSALLQTRADLSTNAQIQSNLSRVKAETDGAEQALQSAVTMVEKARTLGAQGATDMASAESRQSLADQVGSIMEELVGLSRTSVEGRYVFSGDADQQAPYTIDLSQTPPISTYAGGTSSREVQHPNGTRFSVARTAQDIFEATDPANNVFTSLDALRTALMNSDSKGINDAQAAVGTSLTYLNGQLAYYGNVQNKVADAMNFGDTQKVQLQTHLSSLQDADLTQSIMDLNQAQLHQTAALQVRAKSPAQTLFDFLG